MAGSSHKPRLIIIGLDGVGLDMVEQFVAQGELPNLKGILGSGCHASLVSTLPAATYPAWTSFFTGANPGRHGVFDFTERQGYRVRFINASSRKLPTLFQVAEAQGLRCGVLGFPAMFPPEPLKGFCISGWDSPVASEADQRHFHPPQLFDRMKQALGSQVLRFDDLDEFSASDPAWPEQALLGLPRKVRSRLEAGLWLLSNIEVDVFAIYFGEADTASHHLWSFHDPTSPFEGAGAGIGGKDPIQEVYRALDEAVGRIRHAAPHATILVASDHGSGGTGRRIVRLNRWLEEAGFLRFRQGLAVLAALTTPGWGARFATPRMRETLWNLGGKVLPSLVESARRFGRIDFDRTAAMSEELHYAPSILLNLQGREPRGTVSPRDRERVIREIIDALDRLRDPETGAPVILRAWPREEIYHGPFVHMAPDLVLETSLDCRGQSPACRPSMSQGPAITLLAAPVARGSKGGLLPGSHRRFGLFGLSGPDIEFSGEIALSIEEAASLALLAADVKPAWWMAVPHAARAIFKDRNIAFMDQELRAARSGFGSPRDPSVVADRLRKMGYVD